VLPPKVLAPAQRQFGLTIHTKPGSVSSTSSVSSPLILTTLLFITLLVVVLLVATKWPLPHGHSLHSLGFNETLSDPNDPVLRHSNSLSLANLLLDALDVLMLPRSLRGLFVS
jgi:hypothetical protein